MKHVSRLSGLLGLLGMVALAGCGGGSNSASSGPTQDSFTGGSNVVAMTVQPGPADAQYQPFNQPLVSVKICDPTSGTCATIGGILVDTGSYGLRVMGSVLSAAGVTLPAVADPVVPTNGIEECLPFADGYAWGQVSLANVTIGGETTSGSVPIQVIDDNGSPPTAPSGCQVGADLGSVNALGANGVLGVGVFAADCGSPCAQPTPSGEIYYSCPSTNTNCVQHSQPVADQVTNPVADFPVDNNGVILQLPAISAAGASTASGYLVFGIGTESNNVLGGAHVVTANDNGSFTTTFNGQTLASSFIDSGSNALFFNDSSLPTCSKYPDFYCPNATATLTATNQGQDGRTNQVTFTIANLNNINGMNFALDDIGGTAPNIPTFGAYFDWGLPFFFGRTTFFALQGANAGGTVGPYYAY